MLLKHTEVYVPSHAEFSTLRCEIATVSRGVTLNTHLQMAHIPGQTNRREWSVLLPNPSRNAQHAGQTLWGHSYVVLSVRLPPSCIRLRCDTCFYVCRSGKFSSRDTIQKSAVQCVFLQNVKNAEECFTNTANLLPLQTVKIASLQCWQLTCQCGHLLHWKNFKKTAKLNL